MKKILVVNILLLLLPALTGCQILKKTNRTPQSAGFGGYCSNCLLKNIDKSIDQLQRTIQQSDPRLVKNKVVKTPISLRSAVIMNKKGEPVCRVDLLKHPELMPSFAKPRPSQMVQQNRKPRRGLASVERKDDLPPCPDKYFSQLRKMAKNNIVVNSDKSHIRKVAWPAAVAICGLGVASYAGVNALTEDLVTSEDSSAAVSGDSSAAVSEDSSAAVSEDSSAAVSEDSSAAVSEDSSAAVSEDSSAAVSGDSSAAVSEDSSAAVSEDSSAAVSEDSSAAVSEDSSAAVSGDSSAAVSEDSSAAVSEDSSAIISEDASATISYTVGTGLLVSEVGNEYYKRKIKKLKKLIPDDLKTPDDKQKQILQKISKATKNKVAFAARLVGTFCYSMAELTHLVYELAAVFYE